MSRIGKAPVSVPNGVTVTLKDDNVISVKGPKGELTRSLPAAMTVAQENGQVTVLIDQEPLDSLGAPQEMSAAW